MEQKIISFFNEIFEKYKTISDDLSASVPINFEDVINLFVKDQIDILVKALITGDFIDVSNDFPEKLTGLCEKCKSDCKSYIFSDTHLSEYFEKHTDKIFNGVTKILNQFFTLIHQFNITTNHFIYQRQTFIHTNIKGLFELCAYCNLFLLDYSIIDNVSYYEKLSQLENRKDSWHSKEPFSNLKIFEFKLRFLKYKWLKRQKYNNTKLKQFIKETYSEKYVFNNHIIDLDEKIKIGEPYYQTYKEWIEKIEYHYFDDRTEFNFVERSLNKTTHLDTYDLYLEVKFNKDIEPNLNCLKELEHLFREINLPSFSKNSKQKNILYYYNNLFSAMIASNENEADIDKKFKEISNLYKNKKNNNFFLYYKYLDYKIRTYESKIQLKKYNEVDIDYIKNLLFICKSHFEWCKNGFNRIYDFDKGNSTILIEGLEVFYASSFSLPLSISENQQILNKLESDITKLENNLYHGKSTHYLEDFQEELKKNEKKSIEIISLFTAVISFIVGSVASYQFIKSLTQGLIFTLVYTIAISIFIILIFIATRGIVYFKKNWTSFIGLIIAYISLFYVLNYLFKIYEKENLEEIPNNYKKFTNKSIDSAFIKYDSIKKRSIKSEQKSKNKSR